MAFVRSVVIPAFLALGSKVIEYVNDAVATVRRNWPEIQEVIRRVITFLRALIESFVSTVRDLWARFGDNLLSVIRIAFDAIKRTVENAIKIVQGVLKVVSGLIRGDWDAVWAGIRTILSGAWDQIKNIASTGVRLLRELLKVGLDALRLMWDRAWAGIQGVAGAVWTAIRVGAVAMRDGVVTVLRGFVGAVLGFYQQILDGAVTIFAWVPGVGEKLRRAQGKFREFRNDVNEALGGIKDKKVTVSAFASVDLSNRSVRDLKLATGGPVRGAGTSTSDSIRAWLSNGEHVWAAKEVQALGGHAAMEQLRAMVRGGRVPAFADGGGVDLSLRSSTGTFGRDLDRFHDGVVSAVTKAAQRQADAQAAAVTHPTPTPNGAGRLGPAAARARRAVIDLFGITDIGGYSNRNIAGTNKLSKHALGKAIDVMTYRNTALGDRVAQYFLANRGAFGVDNVIWNRRIWNRGAPGGKRYRGVNPHTDHPHIDFFAQGGTIREPVVGVGRSGRGYVLGESGPEQVIPQADIQDVTAALHAILRQLERMPRDYQLGARAGVR